MADDVQLVANTAVLTYAPRSLADGDGGRPRAVLFSVAPYVLSWMHHGLPPTSCNQRPAEARGENGYLHGGYVIRSSVCG